MCAFERSEKGMEFNMSDEKNNDSLKAAKKVLEDISQDEHEIYLAELREKYIMDQKAIAAKGFDNGVQAGIEQIILNMFHQKVPLKDIAKFTKLDIEKVKEIVKKNNN